MKTSDFVADELYSFRAAAQLWGKPLTLFVDFSDEYDLHDTLCSYIDVINERLAQLEGGREAAAAAFEADGTAERLGKTAQALAGELIPDEAAVYCDDGRLNVWTELFLRCGEASLQVTLSPENVFESKGICS
ncbi:MAG: hypothetical protein ACI4Q4_00880 [Oscillospiraceae bacterium]